MSKLWRGIIATRYRKRLLGTAVLLVLVAGAALVGFLASRNFTIDDGLAVLGAGLPDGATDIQFATQAAPTRIFWLRFSLESENAVSALWEQAGIVTPQAGFTPFPQPNPYEAELKWWQPFVTAYSGSYTNTGSYIIEVLVDRSAATGVIIYLRAYAL